MKTLYKEPGIALVKYKPKPEEYFHCSYMSTNFDGTYDYKLYKVDNKTDVYTEILEARRQNVGFEIKKSKNRGGNSE